MACAVHVVDADGNEVTQVKVLCAILVLGVGNIFMLTDEAIGVRIVSEALGNVQLCRLC